MSATFGVHPPSRASLLLRGVIAVGAALLVALVILLMTGDAKHDRAGAPTLGPDATALPTPMTLAEVVDALNSGAAPFSTGADFDEANFATTGYDALTLSTDGGSWLFDQPNGAFTLAATGTFIGDEDVTTTLFDVVVHADASVSPPTLMVAIRATAAAPITELELGDVLTLLKDKKAGSLFSEQFGLVAFQGTEDLPAAALPGDSAAFVAEVLQVETLPDAITPTAGTVDVHAEVDPGKSVLALDMIGADQDVPVEVHGVATSTFEQFANQRTTNRKFSDIYAMSLAMELAPSVPGWAPAADWLSLPASPDPWAVTINYNQADQRIQVAAAGPTWNLDVPVIFPAANNNTLTPSFLQAEATTFLSTPSEIGVTGTIGNIVPANSNVTLSVSANFRKKGSEYVADFYTEAELDDTHTAAGDVYLVKGSSGWSVTVQLDAPDMTFTEIAAAIDTDLDVTEGGLPTGIADGSVRQLRVILDISSSGVNVGITGSVYFWPFQNGTPVTGGVSLMFFSELSATPKLMIGVAPSFRRIGGDDPDAQPVYLHHVLGTAVDGKFDFKVYDPDDPTVGFGVVYSTDNIRVGGDECTVNVPEGADCPAANERTDVPTNISQWLMPMYGYDGSDDALVDSTSPDSTCTVCSFRKDFAPAIPFNVPVGLQVAASIVLPNPIGTDTTQLDACTADATSDACSKALGVLGSLGLDSRVKVAGSIPLNGNNIDLSLRLAVGLMDEGPITRPTWLNDAAVELYMKAGTSGVELGISGKLQLAIKQGFSLDEAEDMFGEGTIEALKNTLGPATADPCARNGVKIVERSGDGGFAKGTAYCSDLLELALDASFTANDDGITLGATASLTSVRPADPNTPPRIGNTVFNDDGWRPMGLDRFQLDQVILDLRIQTGQLGVSVGISAALSGKILTTPAISFAGAVSLLFKPEGITLQGLRIDIGQLSLQNMIEIYEWISGNDVQTGDMPGISLRNLELSIGITDVQAVCIKQGFRLSGDLYVTNSSQANVPVQSFHCQSDPKANDYGTLSPAPAEPCDADDIEAGCVAGIRLVVNERGMMGDAFIAAFDAGPVHLFDPSANPASGRGVSIHFEIKKTGIQLTAFGGAALGGTVEASGCALGKYCDAWASGDFTIDLKANILSGVDLKAFGRVRSGIPGLSFQMLAAGELHFDGALALVDLFTKGILPDANFALHVELANTKAAPDLDYATAVQAQVDAKFGEVLQTLNDANQIVALLRTDPSAAADLLDKYKGQNPDIDVLITVVRDILAGASDADLQASLDWFVNGFYLGLPGIPNLGDVVFGVQPPRCDGLNWGYGPAGNRSGFDGGRSFYPYNFCFLTQPTKIQGACYYIGTTPCDLATVAQKLVVEPLLDIVLAGIDVSTDIVAFAQTVTDTILSGEIFRIDCASLDVSAALSGSLSDPNFKGSLGLGLFLTIFGQPIGVSFEWWIDTEDPDAFVKNVENMFTSIMEAVQGTTESTCWSEEKIRAFFGTPEIDPDEPAPPAVLKSAGVSVPGLAANVVRESDTATLAVQLDVATIADRSLDVVWGDGSPNTVLVVPAGSANASTTHVFTDDNPTVTPADTANVRVTDTSTTPSTVITVPVAVTNVAPSAVGVSVSPGSIKEGESAQLTIAFTDPGALDTHTVRVDWGDGSPSTTYGVAPTARSITLPPRPYAQNPVSGVANIQVTVNDDDSGKGQATASIAVANVLPVVTGVAAVTAPVLENLSTNYRLTWTDPGVLDSHVLYIDWDNKAGNPPTFDETWLIRGRSLYRNNVLFATLTGTGPLRSIDVAHVYADDVPLSTPTDPFKVLVRVVDVPDNGIGDGSATITVGDVAPVVSRDVATQTIQYSDLIGAVTVTASDVIGDNLTATTTTTKGAVTTAGLPAGLSLSAKTCSPHDPVDGRQTCTWKITGAVGAAAGTYVISIAITDDDTLVSTVSTTLVVPTENARVDFATTNLLNVTVAAPGGNSGPFSLKVLVNETVPDAAAVQAAPGDIGKAAVVVTLEPIGPGSTVTVNCTNSGIAGSGYAAVLTSTCSFNGVPVNTYLVSVTVNGGYYAGSGEDVVTVSDPSLGFTTGGGWFYWPGTNERTSFGYTMKYTKKLTNLQGSIVIIRHRADGTHYRIKSNAITGLSIGTTSTMGWASFTGKANYSEPGWTDPIGNYTYTVYVEDRGEPGIADRIWVETKDKDRVLVPAMSIGRTATVGAVTLTGGNIVVPH